LCRAQLAQVLATGLPPIGAQGALLAQVLLGQLLRLPASPLPTCAYVTLIVDLCKLMPVFAKYYAGGVRRLFERCDYLDPQVRQQRLRRLQRREGWTGGRAASPWPSSTA
jgi:hypothetical protein